MLVVITRWGFWQFIQVCCHLQQSHDFPRSTCYVITTFDKIVQVNHSGFLYIPSGSTDVIDNCWHKDITVSFKM